MKNKIEKLSEQIELLSVMNYKGLLLVLGGIFFIMAYDYNNTYNYIFFTSLSVIVVVLSLFIMPPKKGKGGGNGV